MSYETERASTGQETHHLNVTRNERGVKLMPRDMPKTTAKQTMLDIDNSGNIKTQFNEGVMGAFEAGVSDIRAKTTHKQTTIINNYKGIMDKKEGMGYIVNKYDAKTTGKETLTANSHHTGNAGGQGVQSNPAVYTTYDNPQKVRYAAHAVNYQGNANLNAESMSRSNYKSAEIRDDKEMVLTGARPPGPQNFQTSLGKDSLGDVKQTDNMMLKEQEQQRPVLNQLRSQVILSKQQTGINSKTKFDGDAQDTVFADRLQPDLVFSQHNQNPYSLKKMNVRK
jgi:hypothetical protein